MALFLCALLVFPSRGEAQEPGEGECEIWMPLCGDTPNDTADPWLHMEGTLGIVGYPSASLNISWCDDRGVSFGSRSLHVNGTAQAIGPAGFTDKCGAGNEGHLTRHAFVLNVGQNTVVAHACDIHGSGMQDGLTHCVTDTISIVYDPDLYVRKQVTVSAAVQRKTLPPHAPAALAFTVTNPGTVQSRYLLSGRCDAAVSTACTPSSAEVTLAGREWVVVQLQLTTREVGQTGLVSLIARHATDATATDSAGIDVTISPPREAGVNALGVTAGATADRGDCLAIGLGSGAASACGELRLVHALPVTRTLGVARSPTLIFNSGHAEPRIIVRADVTFGAGDVAPGGNGRVEAVLSVRPVGTGGAFTSRATSSWATSEWLAAGERTTRRIALAFDAATDLTGVYEYVLDVSVNSSALRSVGGEVAIVNRRASRFGTGWWLAGVEQLTFLPTGALLRIGGDGSTQVYARDATQTNLFRAVTVLDRPDSLVLESGEYVRRLPGGTRVVFDAAGKHVRTVNARGHVTRFEYAGDELRTVSLPVPAGASVPSYQFAYQASTGSPQPTVLSSISAPTGGTIGARLVRLNPIAGRVHWIQDPDGRFVDFAYSDPQRARVTSRTDRRRFTTEFGYDLLSGLVNEVRAPLTAFESAVTLLLAAEGRGLQNAAGTLASAPEDSAYTLINGPRNDLTDAKDHTRFFVNRFGAPEVVIDALGHATIVTRGDARFPTQVTRLRDATGFVVKASYTSMGDLAETVQLNPFGDGRDATTTYEWDAQWHHPTRVTSSESPVVTREYHPVTGVLLWQQVGFPTCVSGTCSPSTRINFNYTADGQVSSTELPSSRQWGVRDSVEYDVLGNVAAVRTPKGYWSQFFKDALGRDTLTLTPNDTTAAGRTGSALRTMNRVSYSLVDEDTLGIAVSPALPGADGQTLTVKKAFDAEGNLTSVTQSSDPDPNNIGSVITRYEYDRAGRKIKDFATDGLVDETTYNAAGNVVTTTTRRGHQISLVHDAAGRLVRRTVPDASDQNAAGTVERFTYNAAGRVLTADNDAALVRRSYFPNGALKSETQSSCNYQGAACTDAAVTLTYEYTLSGQRKTLTHPVSLAPAGAGPQSYAYDPSTGVLSSVTDVRGNAYRFIYTPDGQLERVDFAGGASETRSYDADGTLIRRIERTAAGAILHDDVTRGDAQGRTLSVRGAAMLEGDFAYSGLGALVRSSESESDGFSSPIVFREYMLDALGNRRRETQVGNGHTITSQYASGTGRLTGTSDGTFSDVHQYDPSGNLRSLQRVTWNNPGGVR